MKGQTDTMRQGKAALSPRETEVLRLVALGRENGDIATELVIAPSTVKSYVDHIRTKLGANNRVQVARWAWEHGIASVEEVGKR